MTDDKLRITLRLSRESKERLKMIQAKLDKNQTETLEALLTGFENIPDLTEKEQIVVAEAMERSGLTLAQIAKRGLLTEARKLLALKEDLSEVPLDKLKDSSMRFRGVAGERVSRYVAHIMEFNDSQPDNSSRLCITPSLIARQSGANRKAITEYFKKYSLTVDDHNNKYALKPEHNRKSTGEPMLPKLEG